jgi:hypothetical protein
MTGAQSDVAKAVGRAAEGNAAGGWHKETERGLRW